MTMSTSTTSGKVLQSPKFNFPYMQPRSKRLNHYTIAIVHAPSKHFYCVDSLKTKNRTKNEAENIQTMFEKFKTFMDKNLETSKHF